MKHKLVLTQNGAAMLFADQDETKMQWSSDDDEGFAEEFTDDFLNEEDVEDILDYLVENGYLDDDEARELEIEEESLEGSGEHLLPIFGDEED